MPSAKEQITHIVQEQPELLRQFPELGYRYDRHPTQHIRILLYGHYRIAYLLKPDNNIDILGVFHGALDTLPLLEEGLTVV